MKVLMYSKQYPPKMGSVSNLKKVSHDLKNTDITFVSCDNSQSEHVTHINIDAQDHTEFANLASSVVLRDDFDIIHAHDFHAYQAAITAQAHSNKPLIIQANETTFDRNEGMKDPMEFAIEKEAFEKADKIIANSPRVRDRISASYKIDSNKITTPQNTLDSYKHAKNRHILSGRSQNKPLREAFGEEQVEPAVQVSTEVLAENQDKTISWMRHGIIDFLVGLGIGFLIALFLIAI